MCGEDSANSAYKFREILDNQSLSKKRKEMNEDHGFPRSQSQQPVKKADWKMMYDFMFKNDKTTYTKVIGSVKRIHKYQGFKRCKHKECRGMKCLRASKKKKQKQMKLEKEREEQQNN